MKREILFRGKSVSTGQWVYGFYNKWKSLIDHEIKDVHSIYFDSMFVMVEPETVGQFTGRLSETKEKIFEHDIIYVDDSGVGGMPYEMKGGVYNVVWNELEAMFILEQIEEMNAITFDEVCSYTILGNIHDNPDLV